MLYLAIDQHRKQLTVNLRDDSGEILVRRQVSTRWDRVREFFGWLRTESEDQGGFVTIVEICGFNQWLLEMLDEYDCQETVLIQPTERSRQKTDHRDANELGELLWVNRHRLLGGRKPQGIRRILPPTPEDAENRQVTELRRRLGAQQTKTVNKIRHILRKHNLEQECPTKGIDTKAAKKWLAEMPLPTIDRLEMDQLLDQWRLWEAQLEEVKVTIQARQEKHATACLVATMPGAGAYTSLALASRIGPIDRFPTPGSLANYWGLTPGCRNSGESERMGSITKRGSAMARFLLGQMVLHALRKDAYMKNWYKKIKKRRGSKVARVAVMRRLTTMLWHMLKHNQPYVCGGPPEVKRILSLYGYSQSP